ncbi:MAG TPA: glycosyltransferase family 2 protein [Anaerolineae bacterium]|nr:glycosyltransferase family 2 protein [Anaerolineae bacterium]
MPSLSVVIPAYNEAPNVAQAVRNVSHVLQEMKSEHEIIVVNDGSQDRTGDIVRELLASTPNLKLVEHFPNRGYGGALKAGFAAATRELIAFAPADNQFDFGEIRLLLDRLTPDVVLVSGRRVDRKDNLIRKFNGFGWNTAVRLLFGHLIKDIDCGFKVFRRDILGRIHVESDGAMIDTEMLAELRARGYKLAEAPVTHLPRVAGSPTGANLKVVLRAFRDLFRFRLRLWRELRDERRAASGPR